MKKITYILLSLAFTTTFAQEYRNVYWAHGLGDDQYFWNNQYVNAQTEYFITSSSFTHPTDQGVNEYADRLRESANSIRGSRTIAIGHSLGGVALRQANKDDNGLYGGIITLGAPLDGARLANEAISGRANRFVDQSVAILQSGPIASASRNKWQKFTDTVAEVIRAGGLTSDGIINDGIISSAIRLFGGYIFDVIDRLGDGFNETILNRFNPNNPSVRDLAENSSYFNSIRNFQSSQPKILGWGNEDSPVHVRLFASSITLNNDHNDLLLTAYNEAGNTYKANADGIRVGGFLCFRKCKRRKREEKEAWNAGADYIRRGWEIAWNELIDARFSERYTTTERVYVCSNGGPGPLQLVSIDQGGDTFAQVDDSSNRFGVSPPNFCRWEYRTVTRSRWVNTPSDGLIKRGSQIGELSNWGGMPVRLDGVNHLEMGVHPESDKLFRDSFKGLHGDFFETASR